MGQWVIQMDEFIRTDKCKLNNEKLTQWKKLWQNSDASNTKNNLIESLFKSNGSIWLYKWMNLHICKLIDKFINI